MTKQEIINKLKQEGGFFIRDNDFKACYDLDGTHAAEYLEKKGFKVIDNRDYGNCGIAQVKYGKDLIELSTNGYICIVFTKVNA